MILSGEGIGGIGDVGGSAAACRWNALLTTRRTTPGFGDRC